MYIFHLLFMCYHESLGINTTLFFFSDTKMKKKKTNLGPRRFIRDEKSSV